MTVPSDTAWHFVLEHTPLIDRAARFRCPRICDLETFRQELYIYIARRAHTYDPERSAPRTWIGWQALHVRDAMLRDRKRCRRDLEQGEAWHEVAHLQAREAASPRAMERRAEVSRILEQGNEGHREAALSVLEGHTRFEVPDALGISYQARDGRLRRLAKHYPDYIAA